jgi:hypothetical protein
MGLPGLPRRSLLRNQRSGEEAHRQRAPRNDGLHRQERSALSRARARTRIVFKPDLLEETMKVMAVGTLKPLSPEQRQQYLPKEAPATLQLYLDGKMEQFRLIRLLTQRLPS